MVETTIAYSINKNFGDSVKADIFAGYFFRSQKLKILVKNI
jgi:hypothetical protein